MSETVTPFVVAVEDARLQDLGSRLAMTRWPERETCAGWDQGIPLYYARELARYWARDYDWRRCEALLNGWPQFTTTIEGIDIHFIHRRSARKDALPLILTHGWPSSILEFRYVIDALANPGDHGGSSLDAFHVVVPSLPGYGFSGKPDTTGTGVERIGRMWGTLMARLGYERYLAHGGDWGSAITQSMALTESAHCAAIHLTMPIVAPDPETMHDLAPEERAALARRETYRKRDSGYFKQQATRPQTLGYGLADSPVGQMAWIVEKFHAWTDCERNGVAHPENAVSRDDLLDNVMLYWLNNCAASSARLYWESGHLAGLNPVAVPTGCSIFPHEINRCSRRWAARAFANLIHFNELAAGGHFAALEQPDLFLQEIRTCFRSLRRSIGAGAPLS